MDGIAAKSGEYPAKPGEGVLRPGVPAKPASRGGDVGGVPGEAGGGGSEASHPVHIPEAGDRGSCTNAAFLRHDD